MDEKSVCANVERLVSKLNGELKVASEMGLRIRIHGSSKEVSVRIWREIEMVNIPDGTAPDWRKWPVEDQVKLLEHLRSIQKEDEGKED